MCLREPANRRLEHEPIMINEISPAVRAGTQRVLDFRFRFGEDLAGYVQTRLLVIDMFSLPLDLIMKTLGIEWVVSRRVVFLQRLGQGNRRQGMAHGVLSISGGHVGMG